MAFTVWQQPCRRVFIAGLSAFNLRDHGLDMQLNNKMFHIGVGGALIPLHSELM